MSQFKDKMATERRKLIEKTSDFLADKGIDQEESIKKNHKGDKIFSFMFEGDPDYEYYLDCLRKKGIDTRKLSSKAETNSKGAYKRERDNKDSDKEKTRKSDKAGSKKHKEKDKYLKKRRSSEFNENDDASRSGSSNEKQKKIYFDAKAFYQDYFPEFSSSYQKNKSGLNLGSSL